MDTIARRTVERAARLLQAAQALRSPAEERESDKLGRMVSDPAGIGFTFALVDQAFRSADPRVAARRFRRLAGRFGVPSYLAPADRAAMHAAVLASRMTPGLVMRALRRRIRNDSAKVILPGEKAALHRHLAQREREGWRVNLNQLGEAVLGEEEAARRLEAILDHLADPAVTCVSVKISAIFSQIDLTDRAGTLGQITGRLRRLYRAALPQRKMVNLDMEEYRDLGLTVEAFRSVLGEPEFRGLEAGIALQAYLPDSWDMLQRLTSWARQRKAEGGAGIKVRLVKGANLAMEKVEAGTHGWRPAPYPSKLETDANFRRMLEYGCRPENAAAVRLGVGSHNLFDVALALVLREENGVAGRVELEMLEGMGPHQARAVKQAAGGLLLYAPVVEEPDFLSAMAYLVRRLDENTAADNFLRDLFALAPDSLVWRKQEELFLKGWSMRHAVTAVPFRREPPPPVPDRFANEPDTDWTQPGRLEGLQAAIDSYRSEPRPGLPGLDALFATAEPADLAWEAAGPGARAGWLRAAAEVLRDQRFRSIACMRKEAKKAVAEADAEVSEAIDFARFYAAHSFPEGLASAPLGIVVVAPPWNFPYSIPCSGILAALMAGNAVIFKPAPETVETGWLLARQLWTAGIPREVLQFFPCDDGETGRALITDPRVSCVVLTGSVETARLFLSWRPSLRLLAETSGKNALIVTAQADRELAIKDLVRSAFGHAGQKCSAASLGILEAEVYDDPVFRRQLRDAARSLPRGPADRPGSLLTPLIRAPGAALNRALTQLDPGEEWLLEPRGDPAEPCAWSPGIKLGVQPGSWFHQTECFGSVLGLMRAESLEQALAWQNGTPYGLTAGMHTLAPEEIAFWKERVEAGNLYVNRAITGAIVQRQPFGGWKNSCIGPGAKAGGPNYVDLFRSYADRAPAGQTEPAAEVERSYREAWREHFSREHDFTGLAFESNVFRYRPCRGVVLRLDRPDEATAARATLAAGLCGVPLQISLVGEEPDEAFARRLPQLAGQAEFLRTPGPVADRVLAAAYEAGLNWIGAPLTGNGRLELRHWLREQSVSHTLHRYGQLAASTRL